MKIIVFILPIVVGIGLFGFSIGLFRWDTIHARQFGISVISAILVGLSPFIYIALRSVGPLLGFRYTFVLGFGLAILVVTALAIYQILLIGQLREENKALWQEVAILQTEIEDIPSSSEDD